MKKLWGGEDEQHATALRHHAPVHQALHAFRVGGGDLGVEFLAANGERDLGHLCGGLRRADAGGHAGQHQQDRVTSCVFNHDDIERGVWQYVDCALRRGPKTRRTKID